MLKDPRCQTHQKWGVRLGYDWGAIKSHGPEQPLVVRWRFWEASYENCQERSNRAIWSSFSLSWREKIYLQKRDWPLLPKCCGKDKQSVSRKEESELKFTKSSTQNGWPQQRGSQVQILESTLKIYHLGVRYIEREPRRPQGVRGYRLILAQLIG